MLRYFREYCKNNKDTILKKTENEVKNINYSEVLFIDLIQIFKMVDDENKVSIWKHLLTLLYMTNPSVELRSVLQDMNKGKEDNESKFLEKMIGTLENNMSEEQMANPMAAMMGLMSSGVLQDLMGQAQTGQSNGSLNIKKILKSVNKLVDQLSDGDDDVSDLRDKLKNAGSKC